MNSEVVRRIATWSIFAMFVVSGVIFLIGTFLESGSALALSAYVGLICSTIASLWFLGECISRLARWKRRDWRTLSLANFGLAVCAISIPTLYSLDFSVRGLGAIVVASTIGAVLGVVGGNSNPLLPLAILIAATGGAILPVPEAVAGLWFCSLGASCVSAVAAHAVSQWRTAKI